MDMTSLPKKSQDEINSILISSILRIHNSRTYLNKISSNLYSQNNTENYKFHKLHSFPLIIKKKNYLIEWNEEEKEKYLNGFFDKIGPQQFKNNEIIYKFFKFILNRKIYKLKIKVNEKMKISSIYLIYTNPRTRSTKQKIILINNNSISTKDSSAISISKNEVNNNNNNKNNNIDFAYSQKNYCNYFPKENEMRISTDRIPSHFPIECYHGVNQIHNNIGNKEFLDLKDNNIFCINNDSYKRIDKKEHLFLNHLYQKNVNKRAINSFTFKYRHKNTTFVYYK